MGYRSEVKIVAGKTAAKAIKRVIKKFNMTPDKIRVNEKGETLIEWDWLKWYEDDPDEFPEVSAIMAVVDKYISLDPFKITVDTGMEYCRAGEDTTDTEYRSNGGGGGYLSIGICVGDEASFKPEPPKPTKVNAKAKTIKPSTAKKKAAVKKLYAKSKRLKMKK